ncbi:MAG: DUF4198 domain-containing protein [Thermoguttaceae bacterium]|nr:DUF4198 domain-containing protein [Thermoguttaceae bacterium]MDW8078897.1 hypothetical protein [Thermoguttaceae bacterium]
MRVQFWVVIRVVIPSCFVGLFVSGCQQTSLDIVPVRGQVLVDGKPAAMVQVICHTLGDHGKLIPPVITDDQGFFRLSTYEQGDGVPAGAEYCLTFHWADFEPISMSFRGEDKLKGRYSDPAKSTIKFRTERGKPVDLGQINLTSAQ